MAKDLSNVKRVIKKVSRKTPEFMGFEKYRKLADLLEDMEVEIGNVEWTKGQFAIVASERLGFEVKTANITYILGQIGMEWPGKEKGDGGRAKKLGVKREVASLAAILREFLNKSEQYIFLSDGAWRQLEDLALKDLPGDEAGDEDEE